MIHYSDAAIGNLSIHHLGSYQEGEGVQVSEKPVILDERLQAGFLKYFFKQFTRPEYQRFTFSTGNLEMNPLYVYARTIFEEPAATHDLSIDIARYLYDHSRHPGIKPGDLIISYVHQLIMEDVMTEAICLFKVENQQPFITLESRRNQIDCQLLEGIDLTKLDKACIIFNMESEEGYRILALDKSNPGKEAEFWYTDFLNITPIADSYHHTAQMISATKAYIDDRVKPLYNPDKSAETGMLERSKQYMKNQDDFDAGDYARQVFKEDELVDGFNTFAQELFDGNNAQVADNFSINATAVKNYQKVYKSVLKLDKNFHVYVHGDRSKIIRGKEEDGRKFYKLYYDEEK